MRMTRLLFFLCVLLFNPCADAQSLSGLLAGKTAKPTEPSSPLDPLKRTSPKSTIYNFLEACHGERYAQAARYLDLRRIAVSQRATQGPELAKELSDILDRDPHFELTQLSDDPAGYTADGLTPDLEALVTVQMNGSGLTLYLQRVTEQGMSIWLVAADSLAQLPQLMELSQESSIEKRLPVFLVDIKMLGTPLWVWLALVLAAAILSVVSRLLSRIVIAIAVPLARRYAKSLKSYRIETFTGPLRLLLTVIVFRTVMEFLAPSALLRDYLIKLLILLFALAVTSLLMRIVDMLLDQIQSRLDAHERALTYSVLPLGVRFLKLLIGAFTILFILGEWGYNTNTILAGLGVGGLAVALAAQKTIENFFGGVSVITDRPVLVGDFFQFSGQVGTVEDIGLRSTRIRTLDRTLVTIPNSQFSTMTLENYSRRDMMWFHPALHLRRDTTADQVRLMMDKLTQILDEHPMVSIGGVPLRFTKIGEQALNLEIFAYVKTPDFDEFLKVQSELLLRFLEASAELGIAFAVPLQESLMASAPADVAGGVYNTFRGKK